MTTESARCANCGQPLGGLAPAGVCSRCLLLTGFEETNAPGGIDGAAHSSSAASHHLPRRFGDYELLEVIARGGMGIVYKARQISLDRLVAVKMLLLGKYSSEEFIRRFRIEASAAASLQHPNIVAIHEVGVYQDQHYFVMDLVDGPDLARIVRDKPLPPRTAARYTKAMAEAIQFAHQRRILHRDLKPSNVLIDSSDQPRITDFGLAKNLSADSDLTITGQVLGSPNYMPPEQASAERGRMGPASDVYSLGAILYHALSGRAPFVGETLADTLQQVLNKEPIAVRLLTPSVPADLETICSKCLEKEPSRRYATAEELAGELGRFLRDEPIHARPTTRSERVRRWCRRNPALSASLGLALTLLLVMGIGSPLAVLLIRRAQLRAEENLYAANIDKAFQAEEANDVARVRERLRWIDESPPQRAMRGWEWRYLKQQAQGDESGILGRHNSWLADLAVSTDGLRLATISENGETVLWDLAAEKVLAQWKAHVNKFEHQPDWSHHAVAFTPDRSTLITAGEDGAVRFWDVRGQTRQPEEIHSITHLPYAVNRLAISSDGKLLAGQGWRRSVYLWQLSEAGPELLKVLETKAVVPFGVAFSPDGTMLLVGWADLPVARYDLSIPSAPREIEPWPDAMGPFAFSPDGRWFVAAGSSRHVVRRWNWPDLTPLPELPVQGGTVGGFAVSPDSRSFVAGLLGGQLNSWDLTNRAPQEAVVFRGHEEAVVGVAFGRRVDHTSLISISWDKSIRLWNPSGPVRNDIVVRMGTPVFSVAISPDSCYLATVVATPLTNGELEPRKPFTLILRELDTQFPVAPPVTFGENGSGSQIVFSPDGKQIAVSEHSVIEFFDVPSLRPQGKARNRGVVYSPDGNWLAYLSDKHILKRTSLQTPERILAEYADFQQLALSPDGLTLASSTSDGSIDLWEAATGRHIGPTLTNHTMRVTALSFAPDGKTLASAGWDGRLGIWDVAHRRNLALLRGHDNMLSWAAYSPDDDTIASGGADNTVRLWNSVRCQEMAVLHGHTATVNGVAFSRDGEWLASASNDGTVHLWHAPPRDKTKSAPIAKP